jgi:uncharacterized spore protein YtfJ
MAAQDNSQRAATGSGPGVHTRQSIRDILENALNKGDIRRVYGEPVERDGVTVVPIADIGSAFGFGAGSGGEPGKEGEGGGGGGKVNSKALGYLEITEGGTRFRPVYDATKIATWGIVAATFLLWIIVRKR